MAYKYKNAGELSSEVITKMLLKKKLKFFDEHTQFRFDDKTKNLRVGIFDEELAQIANWNIKGTEHIPARDFIKTILNKPNIKRVIAYHMQNGGNIRDVGETLKKQLKESLINGTYVANEAKWKARKIKQGGNPNPLRNTDAMLEGIDYTYE